MFALDDPWHKDDNTRAPTQTHASTELPLEWKKKNGEKKQLVGHHLAPTAGGSLQRKNLNFRWRFQFFFQHFLNQGRSQKGSENSERVPLWSIVICGWKFWICLQPLRAYPFPSVACVSPPAVCPSPNLPSTVTCRMRIYIFSCSALLWLLLFLFLQLADSAALCARFESFKRNIVEITLCPTDWSLAAVNGCKEI